MSYKIKNIEINYINKCLEALKVNPNIRNLFKIDSDGRSVITVDSQTVDYRYKDVRIGDRFYIIEWKYPKFYWKVAIVTYKRSGVVFFKYENDDKEQYLINGSLAWKDIRPCEIHIDNKLNAAIECDCPKTKIIYD